MIAHHPKKMGFHPNIMHTGVGVIVLDLKNVIFLVSHAAADRRQRN